MAAAREDPCELLELYDSAPRMAPYLMDRLLERLRARLAAALSAFSPSVPLTFVACALGFDTARQVTRSDPVLMALQKLHGSPAGLLVAGCTCLLCFALANTLPWCAGRCCIDMCIFCRLGSSWRGGVHRWTGKLGWS